MSSTTGRGGEIVLNGGVGGAGPAPDRTRDAIDKVIGLCRRQFTAAFLLLLLSFIGHLVTGITIGELRERIEVLELATAAAVSSDK